MDNAYILDQRDHIVEVCGEWDRFALENAGESACASAVIGQPLFNGIAGDAARMYMQAILMRVRASGEAAEAPYRCDGPREKRFFRMRVTPLPDNRIRVEHFKEREERSPRSVTFTEATAGERAVERCSICCRQKWDGVWTDPFDAAADSHQRVIHTVCDDCRERVMQRRIPKRRRDGAADAP